VLESKEKEYRVHGNKKDGVSHGGLKTTDFGFEILCCDLLKFQISSPKIQKSSKSFSP
jgi:hypothetical protein